MGRLALNFVINTVSFPATPYPARNYISQIKPCAKLNFYINRVEVDTHQWT